MEAIGISIIIVLAVIVMVLFLFLRELNRIRDLTTGNSNSNNLEQKDLELVKQLTKLLDQLQIQIGSLEQMLIFSSRESAINTKSNATESFDTKPDPNILPSALKGELLTEVQKMVKNMEQGLIEKVKVSLINVPNAIPLEVGKIYFVDSIVENGSKIHQSVFKEEYNQGKSIYRVRVDENDPEKAYLSINREDPFVAATVNMNLDRFVAPFFSYTSNQELPAILRKNGDSWEVNEKGQLRRQ